MQAIPVSLAALGLWAVIGGWYIAVAPANLAGTDNIGIVLSTFGACLFLADRLAFYWLKVECWLIIFKLWFWGLLFIAWGLLEWLGSFSPEYWLLFTVHWLASRWSSPWSGCWPGANGRSGTLSRGAGRAFRRP